MRKKEKVTFIVDELNKCYPEAECALHYTHPYELLIATRLSAQCTDERVNRVTPALFAKYPSLEAFANADLKNYAKWFIPAAFIAEKQKVLLK